MSLQGKQTPVQHALWVLLRIIKRRDSFLSCFLAFIKANQERREISKMPQTKALLVELKSLSSQGSRQEERRWLQTITIDRQTKVENNSVLRKYCEELRFWLEQIHSKLRGITPCLDSLLILQQECQALFANQEYIQLFQKCLNSSYQRIASLQLKAVEQQFNCLPICEDLFRAELPEFQSLPQRLNRKYQEAEITRRKVARAAGLYGAVMDLDENHRCQLVGSSLNPVRLISQLQRLNLVSKEQIERFSRTSNIKARIACSVKKYQHHRKLVRSALKSKEDHRCEEEAKQNMRVSKSVHLNSINAAHSPAPPRTLKKKGRNRAEEGRIRLNMLQLQFSTAKSQSSLIRVYTKAKFKESSASKSRKHAKLEVESIFDDSKFLGLVKGKGIFGSLGLKRQVKHCHPE